jgi:hypothetical protein
MKENDDISFQICRLFTPVVFSGFAQCRDSTFFSHLFHSSQNIFCVLKRGENIYSFVFFLNGLFDFPLPGTAIIFKRYLMAMVMFLSCLWAVIQGGFRPVCFSSDVND